jgi:uncharacterized membrane protein
MNPRAAFEMKEPVTKRVLCAVTSILSLTGVVIVVMRAVNLIQSSSGVPTPVISDYDLGFAHRPGLTLLHIVPGLVFVILGPLQFVKEIRARHVRIHRWCGRIFLVNGLLVGTTAVMLGFLVGFGGPSETAAVTFYSLLFLIFLAVAYVSVLRRQIAAHREWMIRAFSLGLAVATMRPLLGILMASTGWSFKELLGLAFWLAFSLHLIVAQLWIAASRRNPVKQ